MRHFQFSRLLSFLFLPMETDSGVSCKSEVRANGQPGETLLKLALIHSIHRLWTHWRYQLLAGIRGSLGKG